MASFLSGIWGGVVSHIEVPYIAFGDCRIVAWLYKTTHEVHYRGGDSDRYR